MKIILLSLLLILIMSANAAAQTNKRGNINTIVANNQQSPIENATIELRKAKDSSLVKTALTDKAGAAVFENILYGEYIIRAGSVGFAPNFPCIVCLPFANKINENHKKEFFVVFVYFVGNTLKKSQ